MSRLGPSHCRYICLKHRVAMLRPQWKVAITETWTWPRDGSCIWLISVASFWSRMKHICTATQQWVVALRPQWKVAVFRNLTAWMDTVDAWRAASRAWTWKWAKWTTIWAVWTTSGQNVRKVGKTFLDVSKNIYSLSLSSRLFVLFTTPLQP